jgi:ATP-dependent Clp protease ATP-binding subunit ClpC
LTDEAARYVLEKNSDRAYGARPLRRALQKYIEDPLSEALIQGTLPRPAELEVYLGDSGIYCRQVGKEGEEDAATVGAGAPSEPGTPLYIFS